ncbi:unnamed protein product [Pleuronectes platessa]|uniref:Uncharacterized protein n=1 Tax=Pleuronectes platessa TaxID=8262 RepID=A0A9N7U507_PLEPL|nr:unnamed protein product [Pleuronectes platessa]
MESYLSAVSFTCGDQKKLWETVSQSNSSSRSGRSGRSSRSGRGGGMGRAEKKRRWQQRPAGARSTSRSRGGEKGV